MRRQKESLSLFKEDLLQYFYFPLQINIQLQEEMERVTHAEGETFCHRTNKLVRLQGKIRDSGTQMSFSAQLLKDKLQFPLKQEL